MNLDEFTKEKLWLILTDTVHTMVMYPSHKAYIRDVILREKPDISPVELASRLNMTLGETLVILGELKGEEKSST
jgi:hypothetical protein